MLADSGTEDAMMRRENKYYDRLKNGIIDRLPTAYSRHNSSNVLKGFSIRVIKQDVHFVVIAIATLVPPESLGADFGAVLEDEFMETSSEVGAVHAMEQLLELVNAEIEQAKKDPYNFKKEIDPYSLWRV